MIVKRAHFNLGLYLLASAVFFVLVGLPVLRGEIVFQFYMDSLTYHELAEQSALGLTLISVGGNYYGPVLIVKALGSSFVLLYFLNIAVLLVSFTQAARHLGADRRRLAALLMICPLMFTSLLSVNKEILAVLGVTLLAVAARRGRAGFLLAALVVAALVRWQQLLVVLIVVGALSPVNPLRHQRVKALVLLVLVLSVVYPAQLELFGNLDAIAQLEAQRNPGSGLYTRFIEIQNRPLGYVLVVVPKALQLFVGHVARWRNFTDFSDVANNVVAISQSAANLVILAIAAWRRRLKLEDDAIFVAAVYTSVFALSPIFSSRYLFPATWLLCIALARRRPALSPEAERSPGPVATPRPEPA